MDSTESERLARLEREMAILRAEFARLRDHVGAPAAEPSRQYTAKTPPPPPRPAAPPPAAQPSTLPWAKSTATPAPGAATDDDRQTFEEVAGRYGTTAMATVMVLMGFGFFLKWAIQAGLLGPTARVVLGYLGAIGLAAGGMRLRMRGTREFGNVLLAMALGVVHLVCWSAGPLLHVLPSWLALSIGFVASVLLAEFALRHEEQALCAIGFGGAAIAPFVTSDSHGSRIALAAYGIVVVALGAAALGARTWNVARAVIIGTIVLYALASGSGLPSESPPEWISARLWVITPMVMLLALIPFTNASHRRPLLRVAAAALILGAFLRADQYDADVWSMGLTLIGTIVAIAALEITRGGAIEREEPVALWNQKLIDMDAIIDSFVLPVGLFLATIAATPDVVSLQSAGIAVAFTLLAVWMTHHARAEPEASGYSSSAALIALWIVPAAFFDQHLARVAGTTAMSTVLLLTALRMSRLPFVAGSFAGLTIASFWAILDADARSRFGYTPFLTRESLGAAIATLGWIGGVRISSDGGFLPALDAKVRSTIRETFITGGSITAFFWGVAELQGAWNQTAATALLIVYYAATGALLIYLGRLRGVKHMRIVGLALALWAAWKSIVEAFAISNVAVKVSVFFAVGAFLIAVGYWYRKGAEERLVPEVEPV